MSDLGHDVRIRVPLPVVIPIASLILIAALVIGFSQVLLSVPKEAATLLALVMASNVLIAAAVVALRRPAGGAWAELLVVALYPVIVGIAIAAFGFGEGAEAEHGGGAEAAAASGAVTVVAQGVAFDTDTLTLTAGEEATVTLDNQDSVPHNLSIYEDESAEEAIFQGGNVDAGQSTEYSFAAPPKGEYFFRCDIHPTSMTGTAVSE